VRGAHPANPWLNEGAQVTTRLSGWLCLRVAGIAWPLHAFAQAAGPGNWPMQPVRRVVGFAPGSATDITASMLAGQAAGYLGTAGGDRKLFGCRQIHRQPDVGQDRARVLYHLANCGLESARAAGLKLRGVTLVRIFVQLKY